MNCPFCYESIDGKRGTPATHHVWLQEWKQYADVCQMHAEEIQARDYAETLPPPMIVPQRKG